MKPRKSPIKTGRFKILLRSMIFAFSVLICLSAFVFIYDRLRNTQVTVPGQASSTIADLDPLERMYLSLYLTLNSEGVNLPLKSIEEEIRFVIDPGQSADQIAANLVASNVLANPELFRRYLRYYGLARMWN